LRLLGKSYFMPEELSLSLDISLHHRQKPSVLRVTSNTKTTKLLLLLFQILSVRVCYVLQSTRPIYNNEMRFGPSCTLLGDGGPYYLIASAIALTNVILFSEVSFGMEVCSVQCQSMKSFPKEIHHKSLHSTSIYHCR
jgi:hypothetical protein